MEPSRASYRATPSQVLVDGIDSGPPRRMLVVASGEGRAVLAFVEEPFPITRGAALRLRGGRLAAEDPDGRSGDSAEPAPITRGGSDLRNGTSPERNGTPLRGRERAAINHAVGGRRGVRDSDLRDTNGAPPRVRIRPPWRPPDERQHAGVLPARCRRNRSTEQLAPLL